MCAATLTRERHPNEVLTKAFALAQLQRYAALNASSGKPQAVSAPEGATGCHETLVDDPFTPLPPAPVIKVGLAESPYGPALVAQREEGVLRLLFLDQPGEFAAQLAAIAALWPQAWVQRDDTAASRCIEATFGVTATSRSVPLVLRGTLFQRRVWQALRAIPAGCLASYQQVADALGCATGVRAVASAVARNELAGLIPCHRVIRSNGDIGQYRWGSVRKRAMLTREAQQGQEG